MTNCIFERISQFEHELIQIRRDIHQHPETAFTEQRTAEVVAGYLQRLDIEVHQGLAKTGVVGTLRGRLPGNRSIGLRADMDALFIHEHNDFDHCSVHDGKMHACGHDGHTSMLLGAARYLSEHRDFAGTVHFIFQPAEESEGGARVMIEEGLFDRFPCDAVYAMHNMPGINAGDFAIRPGPFMAAGDTWSVTIKGTGGHGAVPHESTDPTVAAAQFISALQTVVSRNAPSNESSVVSIGHIQAGDYNAPNIIPSQVLVRGTARTYTPQTRMLVERRIGEIAHQTSSAHGCEADYHYLRRYPALINRPEQTDMAIRAAARTVGAERVNGQASAVGGSEDFAFLLEQVPGAYILIGNGEGSHFVHIPHYDFNDEIISTGASYFVNLVYQELSSNTQDNDHEHI